MGIINLEKVDKDYFNGKIHVLALNKIDLEVESGDFVVLAGPSGSGKTTLLNLMGVMDKATNGRLFIDGIEVSNFSKKEAAKFRREKLGFVFQNYNLIPILTAYENVAFALDLLKIPKVEKNRRVIKVLQELEIEELKDRRPSELSGGQQQRVAIARALVKEPKIVLADEPTANLDSETGENIINLMYKLNKEKKVTFVFSSHDKAIIDRAHRIIKLKDGKVMKEGGWDAYKNLL